MAQAINSVLKGYFNAGDEPTEAQFATLIDSNLNLSYTTLNQEVTGSINFQGMKNMNITEQSGTAAEDLTATTHDLVWYSNAAQAADVTLPDATANNVGMKIKIIVGTTSWSTTAFQLGFADSGTCVLVGQVLLSALDGDATDATAGFTITANAQSLEIDADAVTDAGGAIGSMYDFTYLEANLVHCMAYGMVTTGTPAPTAAASTTTGTA
tara:strand:- start:1084 stop:1716 length:633 start_codon:yes stop_codon:yes gene_type:complete